MPLLKIKNLELRIKNLPSAKKLKIEARSQTETSLLDFGSLSFAKVPKRLKGARVAESPSVCQSAS